MAGSRVQTLRAVQGLASRLEVQGGSRAQIPRLRQRGPPEQGLRSQEFVQGRRRQHCRNATKKGKGLKWWGSVSGGWSARSSPLQKNRPASQGTNCRRATSFPSGVLVISQAELCRDGRWTGAGSTATAQRELAPPSQMSACASQGRRGVRIRNSSTRFASFSCISTKGHGLPWRPSSADSCCARRLHNSARFRARRPACKYEQRARQHAPANLHAATDSASKPTVLDRLEGLHFFYVLDELEALDLALWHGG